MGSSNPINPSIHIDVDLSNGEPVPFPTESWPKCHRSIKPDLTGDIRLDLVFCPVALIEFANTSTMHCRTAFTQSQISEV